MKKTLALILALCLSMVAVSAFAAPAPGEQAGFTEYPVGDDQEYSWDENNTSKGRASPAATGKYKPIEERVLQT